MEISQKKLTKVAILGIAALVLWGIGSAIFNSGWSQGYMMGLLTGQTDGAAMTPYLAGHTRGWHGGIGAGIFGFFGAIFHFIFFIFFIGLIFKAMRFLLGGRHGWHCGPGGRGWQRHGWQGRGWHGQHSEGGQGGPQGGYGERVEGHYGPWWEQSPYPQPQAPQGQPSQGQQTQAPTPPHSETSSGTSSEASGASGDENKPQPTSWTQV